MKSLENKIRNVFKFKVNSLTNKVAIYSLAAALLSNCGIAPKNNHGENEKDIFKHEDATKLDTFEISNHKEDTTFDDSHYEIFTQEVFTEDSSKDTSHSDYVSDIPAQEDSYPEILVKDTIVNNDSYLDISNGGIDTFQDSYLDTYPTKDLIREDMPFEDVPQDILSLDDDSEEVSSPNIFCFKEQYYLDKDEDGYGDKTSPKFFCSEEIIFGYVLEKETGWDCNDNNSLINPDAIEICDAADNNCNDKIDEGMTLKQPCGNTNVGECQYGVEINFCLGGEYIGWQVCDAVYPKEEVCDGKDNDCDGKTDEGLLLQQKCGTADAGECSYGVEFNFCVGKYTGWQLCDAVFPTEEICDGKDNNCNGLTDEMLTLEQECGSTDEGGCDLGVGYKYCKNGVYTDWVDCTAVFPAEEKCNGLDDDCDGETDNGPTLKQECGYNEVGECSWGIESNFCMNGQYTGWKNCTAVFPKKEVCDNLDNDCDGKTDEDLTLEKTCGVSGVGNCIPGMESNYCEEGEYTGWLDCDAVIPSVEVCNGIDDDCNGLVDEGLTLEQSCGATDLGECILSSEFKYCISGEYGEWLGCKAVFPTLEICDSLDNNCDGEADENFPVGKTCLEGEGLCKSEGIIKCTPDGFSTYCNASLGLPVDEKCDNLDNNCNGLTDENLTQACYSICGKGIEICTAGVWMNCTAPLPELEICDYFDNDCNGEMDEEFKVGEVCYFGKGECKSQGMTECTTDGFDTYCTAILGEPKLETCNSLDDNCDGITDENLTQSCSTSCGSGLESCVNGEWKNCTAPKPQAEICDGKDNDCNGKIDELAECCPLVGYWNFDEGAGNIAYDSSGKGNDGTISGATWVEGIVGNAISFDGKDDYIKILDNPSLNPGKITVAGWIKLSDWDFGGNVPGGKVGFLVGKTYQYDFEIGTYFDKKIIFQACSKLTGSLACPSVESEVLDLNKWIYVAGTYDGKKTKLYIDGSLVSSIDFPGSIPYYTGPLGVGLDFRVEGPPNLVDNFFFKGIVDDLHIYSCAVSAEQISMEYQNIYTTGTKKN